MEETDKTDPATGHNNENSSKSSGDLKPTSADQQEQSGSQRARKNSREIGKQAEG
jgi:hypothetical protein